MKRLAIFLVVELLMFSVPEWFVSILKWKGNKNKNTSHRTHSTKAIHYIMTGRMFMQIAKKMQNKNRIQ